jgi:enamine deaminase RidA (YjgF/YER057c/UK114 family)
MVEERQRYTSPPAYRSNFAMSRAIRVGDRILVSGTAAVWPDGSFQEDPEGQARRCFEIIFKALADAGAAASDIVNLRIYLADRVYFQGVADAQNALFGDTPPTATVIVAQLLDPRWKVEIEAEAIVTAGS